MMMMMMMGLLLGERRRVNMGCAGEVSQETAASIFKAEEPVNW